MWMLWKEDGFCLSFRLLSDGWMPPFGSGCMCDSFCNSLNLPLDSYFVDSQLPSMWECCSNIGTDKDTAPCAHF